MQRRMQTDKSRPCLIDTLTIKRAQHICGDVYVYIYINVLVR